MYTAQSKEHTGYAHSRKLGRCTEPTAKGTQLERCTHSRGAAQSTQLCALCCGVCALKGMQRSSHRTQMMQKIANETGDAHTARKLHTGPEF